MGGKKGKEEKEGGKGKKKGVLGREKRYEWNKKKVYCIFERERERKKKKKEKEKKRERGKINEREGKINVWCKNKAFLRSEGGRYLE